MIEQHIDVAIKHLEEAKDTIAETPDKDFISSLLDALRTIEEYYKYEWCPEQDEDVGNPKGTTYEDGTSIEFYIESDLWHRVSLQLRKLIDI